MSEKQSVKDLGVSFEFRTNLFLGTREAGERLLKGLIEAGGIFVPEIFDGAELTGWKKVGFDPKDMNLPLQAWTSGKYKLGIIAERRNPLKTLFDVGATDFTMFDHLDFFVLLDRGGLLDPDKVKVFLDQVGVQKLLDVAKSFYRLTQASWGYIKNDFFEYDLGELFDDEGNRVGYNPPKVRWALRGLFWANFFGPEYVEMFGRNKLLSAPCHKVEQLPDGGLMLLLSESPLDAPKPSYRARKQQLYDYLGMDAFTGTLLPQFRVGPGRKKRDARPLLETGGIRDDIFH